MDKQQQIIQRTNYINKLQGFLSSSKDVLHEVMHSLDWTLENTAYKDYEKKLTACPLNSAHYVSVPKLEDHKIRCLWHQQGYNDDSVPLPSGAAISSSSIVIDKELQANIILKAAAEDPNMKIGASVREREVPQTADRLFSDFTRDERRALYDYVVQKTKGSVPELKEFSLPSEAEKSKEPMTREQLMAAERDAKRRRVRYRKVHTKSKKYSEVMREVINNQMQAYEDWLRDQLGVAGPAEMSEPENQTMMEKEKDKKEEEMVWLDWNFRGNPYTWWKDLLEKKKRRAELKERGENEVKERRRSNGERSSRSSKHRDYYKEVKGREKCYEYNYHHRHKEEPHRDRHKDREYSCHRERRLEDSGKESGYKNVSRDREAYKEPKRRQSHHKQENESRIHRESNDYYKNRDVKDLSTEKYDYKRKYSDSEYYMSKKQKYDDIKIKQENEENSESDNDSKSQFSVSSSKTKHSRSKKSKKKHSKKHKRKKKKSDFYSDKYKPETSTEESFGD